MQQWSVRKQWLMVLWANFPMILMMINEMVNRRSPVKEVINDYLNILLFINCAVILVYGIVNRFKAKKAEQVLRDAENHSWNERMAAKYKNWQSVQG